MKRSKQYGFSLIELMIATSLGLVVSVAVMSMLFSVNASYKLKVAVEEIQENSALALNFIANDIAMTGFKGCFHKELKSANLLSRGAVAAHLRQYDFLHSQSDQYRGSDAITFVSLTGRGIDVTVDLPAINSDIDATSVSQSLLGSELFITDCQNADLFSVTSVDQQRLRYGLSGNLDEHLSVAYKKGTIIYPMKLIKYKLAKGVSGNTGLYRHINNGRAQELIPNVEAMNIHFNVVDPTTGQEKRYSSGKDFDYAHVTSIAIELLFGSTYEVLAEQKKFINLGVQQIATGDRRLYKPYSLNIGLRN